MAPVPGTLRHNTVNRRAGAQVSPAYKTREEFLAHMGDFAKRLSRDTKAAAAAAAGSEQRQSADKARRELIGDKRRALAAAVPAHLRSMWRKAGLDIQTHELESRPDGNSVKVVATSLSELAPDRLLPAIVYLHGGGMAVGSALGCRIWG